MAKKNKWTKEVILKELKRVQDEDGELTRDSYRRKGKIATSQIDKYYGDFSTAKKELVIQDFETKLLSYIKNNKNNFYET